MATTNSFETAHLGEVVKKLIKKVGCNVIILGLIY
jgi:hypothetical protein